MLLLAGLARAKVPRLLHRPLLAGAFTRPVSNARPGMPRHAWLREESQGRAIGMFSSLCQPARQPLGAVQGKRLAKLGTTAQKGLVMPSVLV